jgi:hypothetical protein
MKSKGGVAELGIFLPINLPEKQKWIAVRLNQRPRGERAFVSRRVLQSRTGGGTNWKPHFPARGFKADAAPRAFLASLLIFRVFPKETQARASSEPRLGVPESAALFR